MCEMRFQFCGPCSVMAARSFSSSSLVQRPAAGVKPVGRSLSRGEVPSSSAPPFFSFLGFSAAAGAAASDGVGVDPGAAAGSDSALTASVGGAAVG